MQNSSLFPFTQTAYRYVNRDTRELVSKCPIQTTEVAFLIEANLHLHNYGLIQNYVSIYSEFGDQQLIECLMRGAAAEPTRNDGSTLRLSSFQKTWDALTTKFYTNDYTHEEMVRQVAIFTQFSENTILRAITECEPGKPLAYFMKILERMRAETVPALRREEMYAIRVNTSTPLVVPQFREPGFIMRSVAEESFLRAI